MTATGLSRRSRFWLQWLARLAILAYVFQMSAVDHWHANIVPNPGAAASHSAHCHADASGCTEVSGLTGTWIEAPMTPLPPATVRGDAPRESLTLVEAVISAPDQPPRFA